MENKHPWEKAYSNKSFEMFTKEPATLVKEFAPLLRAGDIVLDVGAGTGRNSIYLAQKGFEVDAVDVADLDVTKKLPTELQTKIKFTKQDALHFNYEENKYRMIIASRLIMYLSDEEVINFFNLAYKALKEDGFLLVSYVSSGGIFEKKNVDVPKYQHSIKQIETLLKESFNNVRITKGSPISTGINYQEAIESWDIVVSKKKIN